METSKNLRKDYNIDNKKLTKFIGCKPKGIYHIEGKMRKNPFVRYLMYMRKQRVNVNKYLDELLLEETENITDDE